VGFYSLSLAKRGAAVTGMELRREYVEIATRTARLYGLAATFHNIAASPEAIRQQPFRFDVTLCFSMLQWVIAQNGMDVGQEVLRAISNQSNALIFDVAVNSGHCCLTCRPGDEIIYVDRLLRESTTYRNVTWIGDVHPYASDSRHVFYCHH
jgi:hypothetical protein